MSGREAEKKRRGHKRRNDEASAFLEGLGSRSFEEKGRRRSALAALKPWNSFFFSFLLSASRALSLSISFPFSCELRHRAHFGSSSMSQERGRVHNKGGDVKPAMGNKPAPTKVRAKNEPREDDKWLGVSW